MRGRIVFFQVAALLFLTLSLLSFGKSVLAADLMGYWNFDESSGVFGADSSGNNNNGAVNGAPEHVAGKIGNALHFSGSQYFVAGSSIGEWQGDYTVALWVKADFLGQVEYASVFANFANFGIGGIIDSFQIGVDGGNPQNYRLSTQHDGFYTIAPVTTDWQFLAVTLSGTTLKTYNNGALTHTYTLAPGESNLFRNYLIGVSRAGTVFFHGIIDEVRVYNGALSAADIQALSGIPAVPSAGNLQFSSATYSVAENGGSATITVTRTGGSTGAVGVSFATSNSTAIAGSDYTATTQTVTFADGDTANKTVSIPILNDALVEGNETVNLTLSNPTGGATLGSPSTAVLTVTDNELIAYWNLDETSGTTAADSSGNNNTGTLFGDTLHVTGKIGKAVDFNGVGQYFIANSANGPWQGDYTVALWVRPDVLSQFISTPVFANFANFDVGGTIDSFQIDVDGGRPGNYRVNTSLGLYPIAPVTLDWQFLTVTLSGTTLKTYNNGALTGTYTLAPGESNLFRNYLLGISRHGTVLFQGSVDEVRVYNRALSAAEIQTLSGIQTPVGTLQFSAAAYSVAENGGSATITITRAGGSAGAVGVSFATSNGTATAGSDFTATTQTVTFADGDTANKTVSIPILDDALAEGNETVNLVLSNPTGGATLGSPSTAVLTINDDETPLPPSGTPVAYWKFDEGSGTTVFDSSGFGNTATVLDGSWTTGKVNGALQFNGASSYVRDLSIAGGNGWQGDYTVALWVKAGALGQFPFKSVFNNAFLGGINSFQIDVDGGNPGNYRLFTTSPYPIAPVTTDWQLLAVTLSGTTLKTYNNGVLTNSYTLAAGESNFFRDYLIGTNRAGTAFFQGTIDEVRVYNNALSAADIQSLSGGGSLQFSAATYSVAENGGSATITVSRTGGNIGAVEVSLATSNGTATAGTDYTATTQTVTFADGDTANKTVSIPIIDDTVFEGNKTVNLTLSNPTGGATLGSPSTAVLTIIENDPPPIRNLQFSSAAYNVAENGGSATITITRTGSSVGAVGVNFATSNGTATAGTGYTATTQTVTFADGDTANKTVSIPIIDNTIFEGNKTVNLTLSSPTGGATLGSPSTAVLTITENDPPPISNLQFSSASYNVAENGGSATITITRAGGSVGAVGVTVATSNGTATAGADYTATTQTVTFADGDTTNKTVSIPIIDDTIFEGNETVNLTLSNPTGGAILGSPSTAVLTITENDPPPISNLQFSSASYNVAENGGSATITITRAGGSVGAVGVTVATSNGTATAGADYTATTQTVTFADGDTTNKTVSIPIIDDTIFEGNETFNLTLSNPTGGAILGSPSTAVLTITDNDTPPSASPLAYWKFDEGSGTTAFDSSGFGNTATVIDGSWTAGKVNGALQFNGVSSYVRDLSIAGGNGWHGDYTVALWVKAGVLGQSPFRSVFNNAVLGGKDSFQLDVDGGNPGNYRLFTTSPYPIAPVTTDWQFLAVTLSGTTLTTYNNGVLTNTYTLAAGESNFFRDYLIGTNRTGTASFQGIIDEVRVYNSALSAGDIQGLSGIQPSGGSLQFSAASYSVAENGGSATITVTRTGGSTGAVGVTFATSNGTATAGSDYTATTQTVAFADGDTAAKTVSVPILDDTFVEGNETVNLTLSNPTGGAILGSPSTAVLTIRDNAGSLQFSAASYSVAENGGSATITVTRTGGNAGAVGVSFATSNGTAIAGTNYTATAQTVSFADGDTAAKTVSIPILNDNIFKGNQTVNLALSNATGGAILGSPSTAVLTIIEANPVPTGTLQFSAAAYSVAENGGSATITITRAGGSAGAVGVSFATSNGTATAGSDYTTTIQLVTFADGDTANKTVSIPIIDDAIFEGNETVNLTLSNPTGGAILGSPSTAVLTIIDNDMPLPSPIAYWKFEEGSGTSAADASGYGNTVTLVNGPSWATGKIGGGLQFDGVNDYAAASPIPLGTWSGDYTVALWVKAGTLGQPGFASVFANFKNFGIGGTPDSFQIDVDGDNPGNYRLTTSTNYTIAPVSTDWQFLAVTLSGTTLKTYNNGTLTNTYTLAAGESNLFRDYLIGTNRAGTIFFQGTVDEVRVYNRALSQQEIQNAADNVSNPSAPIVAITSHVNNQTVTSSVVTVSGTASDAGKGNEGISSVTVNGVAASNGTVSGAGTANWNLQVALNQGSNLITVVAKDNSPNHNASQQQVTVNYQPPPCSIGNLQGTINGTLAGGVVAVSGLCSGNILIRNEIQRIVLDGGGTAVIQGLDPNSPALSIRGKGVTVQGFTIIGGSAGIEVNRGSNAVINNNIIQNTNGHGIVVDQFGFAVIINNVITNNPGAGIWVSESSTARIGFNLDTETVASSNTIQSNAIGVIVSNASSARIVGNDISNNAGDGIEVLRNSQADIASNAISGNGGDGIEVGEDSFIQLGEDAGSTIYNLPNSTATNNTGFGIKCTTGATADGRQGTLNGASSATNFAASCINGLIP